MENRIWKTNKIVTKKSDESLERLINNEYFK